MKTADDFQVENAIKDLQKSKFFRGLDVRDFSKFIKYIQLKVFEPGETIYQYQSSAKNLYFIHSGSVNLIKQEKVTEEVRTSFIGEEAAINVGQYLADAVAQSTVLVLEIPQEAIAKIFAIEPQKQSEFYSFDK